MKLFIKRTFIIIIIASISTQTAFALSVKDSLGDWRKYSSVDQKKISYAIVHSTHQPNLTIEDMRTCITSTAGNGGLDYMTIAEVGAACAIMLKK